MAFASFYREEEGGTPFLRRRRHRLVNVCWHVPYVRVGPVYARDTMSPTPLNTCAHGSTRVDAWDTGDRLKVRALCTACGTTGRQSGGYPRQRFHSIKRGCTHAFKMCCDRRLDRPLLPDKMTRLSESNILPLFLPSRDHSTASTRFLSLFSFFLSLIC